MHCADLDYQIFSILPPFNVVHAQVVQTGTAIGQAAAPVQCRRRRVLQRDVEFGRPGGRRLDQHDEQPVAVRRQEQFLAAGAVAECRQPAGRSADWRIARSTPARCSICSRRSPARPAFRSPIRRRCRRLSPAQQRMPSPSNVPQKFARYDADAPVLRELPVRREGARRELVLRRRHSDPAGRRRRAARIPYPLMRVQAVAKGADATKPANIKGSLDIVLPVASEADCRNCHNGVGRPRRGVRVGDEVCERHAVGRRAGGHGAGPRQGQQRGEDQHPAAARRQVGREVHVERQRRGHAVQRRHRELVPRHSAARSSARSATTRRRSTSRRSVRSTSRRSASTAASRRGTSRCRARCTTTTASTTSLFPAMPLPKSAGRTLAVQTEILDQTCYQCHPGKQTKCLRGAMGAGGVVCQDCHGDMKQVGNDFTAGFPAGTGADLAQARAVGDGAEVPVLPRRRCEERDDDEPHRPHRRAGRHSQPPGVHEEQRGDGGGRRSSTRPRRASPRTRSSIGSRRDTAACSARAATAARMPSGRIRIRRPTTTSPRSQLQGHSGTLIECNDLPRGRLARADAERSARHASGQRSRTGRPGTRKSRRAIATAAGPVTALKGQGTVLSRVAATRTLRRDDDGNGTVTLQKGTTVRCDTCHENKL